MPLPDVLPGRQQPPKPSGPASRLPVPASQFSPEPVPASHFSPGTPPASRFSAEPLRARAARRPTSLRAACRSLRAPCPNRVLPPLAHRLPCQTVPLDLLVEIRARHVQTSCRLRPVPIKFTQLPEQERALGGVLELLERLTLEQ